MNTLIAQSPEMILKRILQVLFVGIVLTFICIQFIDQPVAYWAHEHNFRQYRFLHWLAEIPATLVIIAPLAFLIYFIRFFGNVANEYDRAWSIWAITLLIQRVSKENLKYLFGRYWPETWTNDNLSLIRDHVYGFNFFRTFGDGEKCSSFPSGHSSAIVAAATILCIIYPRFCWVWLSLIVMTILGLVLNNYHFVGDCVGGAVHGWIVAIAVAKISRLESIHGQQLREIK